MQPSNFFITFLCRTIAALFSSALAFSAAWAGAPASDRNEAGKPRISVSVLRLTSPGYEEEAFETAIVALREKLSGFTLDVRYDSIDGQREAVRSALCDLYFGTSGFFWEMQREGLVAVATLASETAPNPNEAVAGAIVVRAGTDFRKIEDLRGSTAAATQLGVFLNSQMSLGEIASRGCDPWAFFSKILQVGRPMERVVDAVLSGKADAGLVKAGLVEELVAEGTLAPDALRVLEPKSGDTMRLLHTSAAYPGWTVAASSSLSPEVLRDATLVLLGNEKGTTDAWWLPATEFSRIDHLFRALRYGPYDYLNHWTLERVWAEFQVGIVLLGALALFSVFHFFRSESVIRRKTTELADAAERISRLEKMSAAGELSTIVAHELLQPLSAARCFLTTLSKSIDRDPGPQTERLAKPCAQAQKTLEKSLEIVEKIRRVGQTKHFTRETLDLAQLVRRTAEELVRGRVIPELPRLSLFNAPVEADPLEMEILLTNLIRNASEASVATGRFGVTVSTRSLKGRSMLRVENVAKPLTDAERNALSTPLISPKPNGLGLGISIVQNIAEQHDGRLTFSDTPAEDGLVRFRAEVTFPTGTKKGEAAK